MKANAQLVNGVTTLAEDKLAEALGVHVLRDSSGLLVYSDFPFHFSGNDDAALKVELFNLLNLRLKVDGEYVTFFNPKQGITELVFTHLRLWKTRRRRTPHSSWPGSKYPLKVRRKWNSCLHGFM
ncbi:hypothetical protein ASG89_22770 [Paenibacillus sp. Soil766]|uniref:hypothetical protein n=1 Tax=Paenibacillus sp. Soil766 TaxID=1736404 RepID=UPI00070D441D|nr:hypothetical protein [Paenibacillus sp. Soil766]KRF03288.1 hypothetical protein ASG89_22770 [Paenibacillus sp. Soil766]